MNPDDKEGTGRGEGHNPRALPIRLPRCRQAPPQDIKAPRDGPKGLRRVPAQSQTKTTPVAQVETGGGRSPAPPARACLLFSALGAVRRARARGRSAQAGREGGGSAAASTRIPLWEPRPDLRGACPRLARGREGEEEPRGSAAGRPICECASAPSDVAHGVPGDRAAVPAPGRGDALGAGTAIGVPGYGRRRERGAKGGCRGARERGGGSWKDGWPSPAARRPHATSRSPWQWRQPP